MRKCCVPGCRNRRYLHSVPFTKPVWRIWLSLFPFLRHKSYKQLDGVKICRAHFLPKYITEKKRLTADAIPSLNLLSSDLPKHDTVSLATNKKYLEVSSLSPNQPFDVKVVDCIPTENAVTDKTAGPPLGKETLTVELNSQANVNSDQLLNRDPNKPYKDIVHPDSHTVLLPTLESSLPASPEAFEESYEQSALPSSHPTTPSIENQMSSDSFRNKLDFVTCDNSGLTSLAMSCCVDFCSNTSSHLSTSAGNGRSKHEAVSFCGFPSEAHLRAAWLRALGKLDCQLPDSAVVCSQHFLHDDVCETEGGVRQLRTGAVPSTVLVCMICFNTDSKMLLMSQYNLEDTYVKLTGYPLWDGGNLKQTLCMQCAQRLRNFSRFREQSLRARSLMMELLEKHELITLQHIKMLDRVKYQLDNDFVLKTIEPDSWDLYIEENDEENTQMETEDVQNAEVKSEYGDETVFIDEDTDNVGNISDDPLKLESMQEVEQVESTQGLTKDASSRDHTYTAQDGSDDGEWYTSEECQVDGTAGSGCNSQPTAPHTEDPPPLSHKNISYQAPSENEENTLFACNVCGIGFKQINLLVNHLKLHTKTEKFSCKLCPFKSKYQRLLKRHNKQNHTKKPHADKQFACRLCEFKCSAKCDLHIHMKIHTGEMNFACELCEYKTEHKTNLIKHMISHKDPAPMSTRSAYSVANKNISYQALSENEENTLFACNVCGIGFKQINLLVNHLKFHTKTFNAESRKFNCKLCPFKSKYKSSLEKHNMQNHTKKPHADKPFACQLCEFKCSAKCDLHIPMKIHTGEMNFACELCEYKTEHKTNLIRHMISHKSERPFVREFMTVGLTT